MAGGCGARHRRRAGSAGRRRNLQDHLQLRMAFRVEGVRTLNTLSAHWWGKLMIGAEYALLQRGPMSMAPSQLGAFANPIPTIPRSRAPISNTTCSRCRSSASASRCFNAFTASVCHLRPTSRGSVHIASADPGAAPAIAPNYLSTDHDRHVAANAAAHAPDRVRAGARALSAGGNPAGPAVSKRSRADRGGRRRRHDDLPSGRHLPDGACRR